jgi:type I restriction enzyme S subunit
VIQDLKPYPVYKESAVPWLGRVPEHWEVLPNRALFAEVIERDHADEQMLSVTITRGVMGQKALLEDTSKKDSSNRDKSAYKLVRPGDIAYNKMRAWQGAIGISDSLGIVSPAYVVERLRHANDPRYFHYLFRTPQFAKEAERWSYGITSDMWSLRPEHFRMIGCSLPPLKEQAAIVRYLDHADRKVRHAIHARQQLIKLLTEQKQAVIQRAVTRGLDPNVRLKPSGVPWLGDVPEHWEILRLKDACQRIVGGSTPRSDKAEYWNGDVVWVTPIDVTRSQRLDTSLRRITREGLDSCSARLVPAGSIIVTCRAPVGKAAVATTELCTNQGCKAVVLRPEVLTTAFGALLIRTLEPELQSLANGTTFSEIPLHKLACVTIPVPTIDEQITIVQNTEEATVNLDKAIDAARREIDLLREYRTRLIADVVTGKLDVRDVVVPDDETDVLPEELENIDDVEAIDQCDDAAETDSGNEETA